MKKYDFTKYELWFSRSALQLLACAERKRFNRYTRRVWRSFVRLDRESSWKEDEVSIPRIEGKRIIRRDTEIFDLDTSYEIMSMYHGDRPSDYELILKRLEELKVQNRNEYAVGLARELKIRGEAIPFIIWDELSDDMIRLLEVLAGDNFKRKRLIVDLRNEKFKIVEEVASFSMGAKMPRPRFVGY